MNMGYMRGVLQKELSDIHEDEAYKQQGVGRGRNSPLLSSCAGGPP